MLCLRTRRENFLHPYSSSTTTTTCPVFYTRHHHRDHPLSYHHASLCHAPLCGVWYVFNFFFLLAWTATTICPLYFYRYHHRVMRPSSCLRHACLRYTPL